MNKIKRLHEIRDEYAQKRGFKSWIDYLHSDKSSIRAVEIAVEACNNAFKAQSGACK